MAFCKKCGTQVSDGVKFCPSCGTAIAQEQQPVQETSQKQAQTQQTAQQTQPQQQAAPNPGTQNTQSKVDAAQAADKINETISKIMDTADTSADYDASDIENNKLLAIFSYIGLLFLIPLFAAKESKFARFHVNQGIVLFAASFIYGIIVAIISLIFGRIPIIGAIVMIILGVAALVPVILMILGIYNAATGRAKELPLIGQIRIIK